MAFVHGGVRGKNGLPKGGTVALTAPDVYEREVDMLCMLY